MSDEIDRKYWMRLREARTHTYWHGTDRTKLKELKPRFSKLVGRKVVFAATFPEVAVAMTCHWTDDDFDFGRSVRKGQDPDSIPYTLKELWEGAFEEFFSQPISLYEVDGKTFMSDPELQDFEVISEKPVKIEEEHRIENPLDYLHNTRMVKLQAFKD